MTDGSCNAIQLAALPADGGSVLFLQAMGRTRTKRRLANMFVVPASAGWLLLALICGWQSMPAEAGTTNVVVQNPPELPKIIFENFGPGIREQVMKADEGAR